MQPSSPTPASTERSMPVRFLVCGAGSIGREYALRHLVPANGAFVAGIVDRDASARKALAGLVTRQQAGGVVTGRKYQESVDIDMGDDSNDLHKMKKHPPCPDFASIKEANTALASNPNDLSIPFAAVYVGTPPGSHAPLVREAFSLGKHVLLEKPIAASPEDGDGIVKVAESASSTQPPGKSLFLNVNIGMQYNKALLKLCGEIQIAAIQAGSNVVESAAIRLWFRQWPRDWQTGAKWVGEKAEGGPLREVGTHYLFGFQKLFGSRSIREISNVSVGYNNAEHSTLSETSVRATMKVVPTTTTTTTGDVIFSGIAEDKNHHQENHFFCDLDIRTNESAREDDMYEMEIKLKSGTRFVLHDFTSLRKYEHLEQGETIGEGREIEVEEQLCSNEGYGRAECVLDLVSAIQRATPIAGVTARAARDTQTVVDALLIGSGVDSAPSRRILHYIEE
ncbi:unnamed protein product [Amoebophrya sp. A25]|nr:unnamed protein product [Amoebophrya sp. A25]|eukprot:GSA25T00010740001.1